MAALACYKRDPTINLSARMEEYTWTVTGDCTLSGESAVEWEVTFAAKGVGELAQRGERTTVARDQSRSALLQGPLCC